MISILCKHWQINSADEFGRIFRVSKPTKYFSGGESLPVELYTRFSTILTLAEKLDKSGEAAFALQEYIDENELSISMVANLLGKDGDSIKRWLRLDASPNRNSVVRIASLISGSPLDDEWFYQMGRTKKILKDLGINQDRFAKKIGVSHMYFNQWLNFKTVPTASNLQLLLPWFTKYNDTATKLISIYDAVPCQIDWKQGRPSKSEGAKKVFDADKATRMPLED
tara:strand:- start:2783 stop:3457 length:675 start_codon:yes stop_codon:yes gene_type:complete